VHVGVGQGVSVEAQLAAKRNTAADHSLHVFDADELVAVGSEAGGAVTSASHKFLSTDAESSAPEEALGAADGRINSILLSAAWQGHGMMRKKLWRV
jgi:hypothetical protein